MDRSRGIDNRMIPLSYQVVDLDKQSCIHTSQARMILGYESADPEV